MEVDPKRTAIHEAGHAVMRYIEGFEITEISIIADDDSLGYAEGAYILGGVELNLDLDADDEYKSRAYSVVRMLVGGIAAEKVINIDNDQSLAGSLDDLYQAHDIIRNYVNMDEVAQTIDQIIEEVRNTLSQPHNARAIKRLSEALLKDRKLPGEDATTIIREALNG